MGVGYLLGGPIGWKAAIIGTISGGVAGSVTQGIMTW